MNITKINTPNRYNLDTDIKAIVLHTTLGNYRGTIDWFMTSPAGRLRMTGRKSYTSAHAVFGRLGQITTLSPLNMGTWHAGVVSKPSQRAKKVLPKNLWGTLKNPNRSTIGLEFASGYDIDKDGVLENWEKLYTPQQIKSCAEFILNVIEPKTGKRFDEHNILTHKDITNYKPDLEIQRSMVLAELKKQREQKENPKPPEPPPVQKEIIMTLKEDGETRKFNCNLFV